MINIIGEKYRNLKVTLKSPTSKMSHTVNIEMNNLKTIRISGSGRKIIRNINNTIYVLDNLFLTAFLSISMEQEGSHIVKYTGPFNRDDCRQCQQQCHWGKTRIYCKSCGMTLHTKCATNGTCTTNDTQ